MTGERTAHPLFPAPVVHDGDEPLGWGGPTRAYLAPMRRLRVCHVSYALLHGTETFVQARLVGKQFEPVAITWERVSSGLETPCPSLVVAGEPDDGNAAARLLRLIRIAWLLAKISPDVVHVHFGHIAPRVDAACRLLGLPLVVSFYGSDASVVGPERHRRYRVLFERAVSLTAEGPSLARRLKALGARPETIDLLPLSLPPWAVAPPPTRVDLGAPVLQLLQVARFTEKKGIDLTLRALALARRAGVSAELLVLGDGPLRPTLERLTRVLGLAPVVRMPGYVAHAELPRVLAAAHALIQPSRTAADGDTEGGAPTILCEAQAQGVPVLATNHCDIPSVVRNGETALLVNEDDPSALAALIAGVARDRAFLARLGAAARPFALRRHDPDLLVRLRERVYRHAIRRQFSRGGPGPAKHARHSDPFAGGPSAHR